ncbi:MAG: hypothetical protein HY566_01420 [Candidatus Kerfeldbacteria bacterium]|nr:hypothetical protein [Candidatus Kerfeldbacteria bacterium]
MNLRTSAITTVCTLALFLALSQPAKADRIACCMMEDGTHIATVLETSATCASVHGVRFQEVLPEYCPDIASPGVTVPTSDTSVQFSPNVGIPGSETFQAGAKVEVTGRTLGQWIAAMYGFLAGALAIVAAVMVMWGGFKWLTASGNTGRVQDAKDTIYSAIISIVLILGAYILLFTINPELVKIVDLSSLIRPVGRIEQPSQESGPHISEAILLDPAKATEKDSFNAKPCPSFAEMNEGIEVYLTGYYRPDWNEKGGYSSFACNVGMQCRCERDKNTICTAGSLQWPACDLSKLNPSSYCNATASTRPPVEYQGTAASGVFYSAAASECFGFGTTLELDKTPDGSPPAGEDSIFSVVWSVEDRGPDIRGRHLDLYLGTGQVARARALNVTGRAVMKVKTYCTPTKVQKCYDNLALPINPRPATP